LNVTKPDWWSRKGLLAACVLLSFIPLLLPAIPPLVDLPGHMGRYAVQLDPAPFRAFYSFQWRVIGNLGVDLLIEPLGRLLGVELAAKLIVMSIPALTVAAMIAIAREVHGDVPPTAFFAFPLAWSHPFVFGFVNFALAMALAMLAFALWLRMVRLSALRWRPFAFAVIACVVWVTHTFGWGVLGLLCFAAELYRQRDLGRGWIAAGWASALACLPMALPLIPMLIWRADATDTTRDWFNMPKKILWLVTALRDRWQVFDSASVFILLGLIVVAIRNPWLKFARSLGLCALILLAAYLLLPRKIFGSAYADMRLIPFVIAFAVLSIRPKPGASRPLLGFCAVAGLVFFGVRLTANTMSFAHASARYDRALVALDHIPQGARVATFVMRSCNLEWSTNRMEHIPALVMVRRQGFSNDQWDVSGANLLTVVKNDAPGFDFDASQMVVPKPCRNTREWKGIDESLGRLPRAAFDYLWLVDIPQHDERLTADMTRVWSNGPDQLYRIKRP
jgi:hypothetical protein